jgi:hypothetical protein
MELQNKKLTPRQKARFDALNLIHPTKLNPNEKYEFNLPQKKFYKDQGTYFIKYADNIRKRHGVNPIAI